MAAGSCCLRGAGNARAPGGTRDLHQDKGQVALARAGLLDAFRAIARHDDQEQRDVDPLTGIVSAGSLGPEGSMDRPEIDRGVLRQLLLDALPGNVVQWNRPLAHIGAGHVRAHRLEFSDGTHAEADVVIGADGAWSRVRPALTSVAPAYTGITFFEGWIDTPSTAISELVGRGTLFAFGGTEAIVAQRNGMGRICVYAGMKRSAPWLASQLAQASAAQVVQTSYRSWAPNLRALLQACAGFAERPIDSLPADIAWTPRDGITLIGDAAHLMPPVGLGVNLAMLDAADLATALCHGSGWRLAMRDAEAQICQRASLAMPFAIEGFQQWFIVPSADGASQDKAA